MAMVGFDDIFAVALKGVELTTVSQKKYGMGSLAVKILIDKIEKGSPPMMNQIMLEPELIIRKSCGYGIRLNQNSV
jgi:DNA-binding LacI/PurR family transcriptional regulator